MAEPINWIDKVKDILDIYCDKKYGDFWEFEIYCNYDDEFSDETIIKFMKAEDPRIEMQNLLAEWSITYDDQWLFDIIKTQIGSELYAEKHDKINEYINENVCFYYPEDHFNRDVCVNIMVDTGDGNKDFVCNNILNYFNYYTNGKLLPEASIAWLVKQQRKKTIFDAAIKNPSKCKDEFANSVIQELYNLPNHMSTLTFLVKMPLFQLFELHEAIKAEERFNQNYDTRNNKGTGYIVISKETMCGLFDPWDGGGSMLEIELCKDVKLPIRYIWSAVPDGARIHDVGNIYGLMKSAWIGEILEIHKMKGA